MPEARAIGETVLEVISPDTSRRIVRVTESPFFIGRGGITGNHLQLDASAPRLLPRAGATILKTGATGVAST
jgi:hypothetical protein